MPLYKNRILFFSIPFLLNFSLSGQDIHFSQYFNTPVQLNSALSAFMPGNCRFGLDYRDQWRSADVPFSTFTASLEHKTNLLGSNSAINAMVFHDKSGYVAIQNLALYIGLNKAWEFQKGLLAVGIQPGIFRRSLFFPADATLPMQYNASTGHFESGLDPGESLFPDAKMYLDINLGTAWTRSFQKFDLLLGISGHHVNFPNLSFREDGYKQPIRANFLGTARYRWKPGINLNPGIQTLYYQGEYNFVFGNNIYFLSQIPMADISSFYLGVHYRMQDALIAVLGFNWRDMTFGFSYDMTMSSFKELNNGIGAFEISLLYDCSFNPRLPERLIPCRRY